MKTKSIFWMAALGAVVGCGGNNDTGNNYLPMTSSRNVTPEAVDRASKSLKVGAAAKVPVAANEFGFKLFKDLIGKEAKENIVLSPTSISLALAMVSNGAAGDTKKAFDKALGVENLLPTEFNQAYKDLQTVLVAPDPKVQLTIANSLWAAQNVEFKREFTGKNTDFFGAKVSAVDFTKTETLDTLNQWVSDATEKKIPKLFETLDPLTILTLINAITFKGEWSQPFKADDTKPHDFMTLAGKSVQVPMMKRTGDFSFRKEDKFSAVDIPFGDGKASMVIWAPNSGVNTATLLKEFNGKKFAEVKSKFQQVEGSVSIPKFKSEYSKTINEQLKQLGLAPAFDSEKANFTAMTDLKPAFISNVLHKAVIEVDEKGAEAAAATGVEIKTTSAPNPDRLVNFVADKPFLYAIVEKSTGTILFMGLYGQP